MTRFALVEYYSEEALIKNPKGEAIELCFAQSYWIRNKFIMIIVLYDCAPRIQAAASSTWLPTVVRSWETVAGDHRAFEGTPGR